MASSGRVGRVITKRAPGGSSSASATRPWCAWAMAATMDEAEPEPLVVGADDAAAEALEDVLAVGLGHAGAGVADPQPRTPSPSIADPMAIVSPALGVLDGVVGELQDGLGDPLLVQRDDRPRPRASSCQSRSARPRAFDSRVWVSRSTLTGAGVTKSGRSDLASRIRSPTRRAIRSISSSSSARVSATSAGSSGSSSSRWPRSTVSGVLSSWPASSRNCRCPTNACSSRASMSLSVRVRAVRSSLPRSGIRRHRSVSPIVSAVVRRVVAGRAADRTRQIASRVIRPRKPTVTTAYVWMVRLSSLRSSSAKLMMVSAPVLLGVELVRRPAPRSPTPRRTSGCRSPRSRRPRSSRVDGVQVPRLGEDRLAELVGRGLRALAVDVASPASRRHRSRCGRGRASSNRCTLSNGSPVVRVVTSSQGAELGDLLVDLLVEVAVDPGALQHVDQQAGRRHRGRGDQRDRGRDLDPDRDGAGCATGPAAAAGAAQSSPDSPSSSSRVVIVSSSSPSSSSSSRSRGGGCHHGEPARSSVSCVIASRRRGRPRRRRRAGRAVARARPDAGRLRPPAGRCWSAVGSAGRRRPGR